MIIKMFTWTLIFISSILPCFSTPLSLASMIFIQCIIISLLTRFLTPCSWIPLTIFMVTIGGLLIIFMYTTSINANLCFKPLYLWKFLPVSILLTPPFLWIMPFLHSKTDSIAGFNFFSTQFFKLFLPLNSSTTLFVFCYLIFVLIIMISLLKLTKGPMRKKY